MIKTIEKRFLPLFLVLVVLISLFPAVPAFAADASSSEGDLSSVGPDISSGDVAVLASYTVSGVWVIKSSPSISRALGEAVNFVSNGKSFTLFSTTYNVGLLEQIYITYGSGLGTCVYDKGKWTSDAYRTIDFGSTPQSVSVGFYDWLTSNATKQQTKTTYRVYVDGSLATSWSVADSSVELDLRVHEDSISVGFPEHDDEYYSVDYSGSPYLFGGMCKHDEIGCCDYMVSSSPYTITLNKSNPILYLTCAYKYPLYIDPNGGTWNGSSDISEFWEFAGTDTEDIVDPVRDGYTFDGWTLSGVGDLNDAGDPPHIYQHGVGSGTLTASWTKDVVPTYTHTISIDGSSYTFTAENKAPPVTIEVTSSGITMSYGDTTKTWTYSGADTFVGIKDSSGNICYVGSSFSVLGSSGANKTSTFTVEVVAPEPEPDPDPDPSETYTHTIIIGGSSYVFVGETGAPPVTFDVRDDYVILTFGDQEKYWYYQGSGTFQGIRNTATGDLHGPAAWFSLLGSTGSNKTSTFTVEVVAPEPTYYNTIYIDGVPYQFSGTGSSPDVQLTVQENGCILTSGSTSLTYLYSGTGTFTGLSFVAGTDPNLLIGTVITIDGSDSGDSSYNLYACYEEVLPDQDEEFQGGVLGWLKYLSEKIRDLPGAIAEKMASAALPAPLQFIFSIFDFDSLRNFFVDMYNQVKTVFGLKTLMEDPAGPFAWLMAS